MTHEMESERKKVEGEHRLEQDMSPMKEYIDGALTIGITKIYTQWKSHFVVLYIIKQYVY